MKAILPGVFPERAFPTEYALKDLSYALELAAESGLRLEGAELAGNLLNETIARGHGHEYFPVLSRLVEQG
jgi:3-hydroxyisobutyrate dehydrogenase